MAVVEGKCPSTLVLPGFLKAAHVRKLSDLRQASVPRAKASSEAQCERGTHRSSSPLRGRKATDRGQWKALMEGYTLQWMVKGER